MPEMPEGMECLPERDKPEGLYMSLVLQEDRMSRLSELNREMSLQAIDTLYRHTAYWGEQNDLTLIVNAYFDLVESVPLDRLKEICNAERDAEIEQLIAIAKGYAEIERLRNKKTGYICTVCCFPMEESLEFCPACKSQGTIKEVI